MTALTMLRNEIGVNSFALHAYAPVDSPVAEAMPSLNSRDIQWICQKIASHFGAEFGEGSQFQLGLYGGDIGGCTNFGPGIAIQAVLELMLVGRPSDWGDFEDICHEVRDEWDRQRVEEQKNARMDSAKGTNETVGSRQGQQAFVYFILHKDAVKIGHSVSPQTRTASIIKQMKAEEEAVVLGILPESVVTEAQLHEQFADIRLGTTEWFRAEPELLEFIEQNCEVAK